MDVTAGEFDMPSSSDPNNNGLLQPFLERLPIATHMMSSEDTKTMCLENSPHDLNEAQQEFKCVVIETDNNGEPGGKSGLICTERQQIRIGASRTQMPKRDYDLEAIAQKTLASETG